MVMTAPASSPVGWWILVGTVLLKMEKVNWCRYALTADPSGAGWCDGSLGSAVQVLESPASKVLPRRSKEVAVMFVMIHEFVDTRRALHTVSIVTSRLSATQSRPGDSESSRSDRSPEGTDGRSADPTTGELQWSQPR